MAFKEQLKKRLFQRRRFTSILTPNLPTHAVPFPSKKNPFLQVQIKLPAVLLH